MRRSDHDYSIAEGKAATSNSRASVASRNQPPSVATKATAVTVAPFENNRFLTLVAELLERSRCDPEFGSYLSEKDIPRESFDMWVRIFQKGGTDAIRTLAAPPPNLPSSINENVVLSLMRSLKNKTQLKFARALLFACHGASLGTAAALVDITCEALERAVRRMDRRGLDAFFVQRKPEIRTPHARKESRPKGRLTARTALEIASLNTVGKEMLRSVAKVCDDHTANVLEALALVLDGVSLSEACLRAGADCSDTSSALSHIHLGCVGFVTESPLAAIFCAYRNRRFQASAIKALIEICRYPGKRAILRAMVAVEYEFASPGEACGWFSVDKEVLDEWLRDESDIVKLVDKVASGDAPARLPSHRQGTPPTGDIGGHGAEEPAKVVSVRASAPDVAASGKGDGSKSGRQRRTRREPYDPSRIEAMLKTASPSTRKKLMALRLSRQGHTRDGIALITQTPGLVVRRWLAAYRNYGLAGLMRASSKSDRG